MPSESLPVLSKKNSTGPAAGEGSRSATNASPTSPAAVMLARTRDRTATRSRERGAMFTLAATAPSTATTARPNRKMP